MLNRVFGSIGFGINLSLGFVTELIKGILQRQRVAVF